MTYARFLAARNFVQPTDVSSSIKIPAEDVRTKRKRLAAALRPPFLDGDFVGPLARAGKRVRIWWNSLVRGGTADETHLQIRSTAKNQGGEDEQLSPNEVIRRRFLSLRDQKEDQEGAARN